MICKVTDLNTPSVFRFLISVTPYRILLYFFYWVRILRFHVTGHNSSHLQLTPAFWGQTSWDAPEDYFSYLVIIVVFLIEFLTWAINHFITILFSDLPFYLLAASPKLHSCRTQMQIKFQFSINYYKIPMAWKTDCALQTLTHFILIGHMIDFMLFLIVLNLIIMVRAT